jgi:hypothetical protein
MAPSEGYPTGCSLVFSTALIMSTEVRSNQQRRDHERPALVRFGGINELPLRSRERLASQSPEAQEEAANKFVLTESDRVGHPLVVIKLWAKDSSTGDHHPWSQPSTPLQHMDDLGQMLQSILAEARALSPAAFHDIHRRVVAAHDDEKRLTPWMIIASDGGGDETMRRLQTQLVLAALMQHYDLDGIELLQFCPNHSKMYVRFDSSPLFASKSTIAD